MKLRNLILPVVLVAGLAFAATDAAAAPVGSAPTGALYRGHVHVGGGVGVDIPIGGSRVAYPAHSHGGYWTTITEQVWVPGHVIGYDRFGHPIMTAGHYQLVQRQVWVPAPRRVYYRPRPFGSIHIGLGGLWRIR